MAICGSLLMGGTEMKRLFVLALAAGGLLLFGMQDAQAASGAVNRLKRDLDNCVLYYKSSSQK
jgi:hypothetical protein